MWFVTSLFVLNFNPANYVLYVLDTTFGFDIYPVGQTLSDEIETVDLEI